jgi:hypothetical protein
MSTEKNKRVFIHWIDAWNSKDVTVLEKLADEYQVALFVLACSMNYLAR